MEIILLLFIFLELFFIEKILKISAYNRILIIIFFIYIIIISNVLPCLFFNNYFFPGKPDQYSYYDFALNSYNKFTFNNIITFIFERNFSHFLYYIIYIYVFKVSVISPIITMRLLNFIAHLGTVFISYKTLKLLAPTKASLGSLILLLSPTFLAFDFYVIRDTLIIFFTSLFLYYLVKLFKTQMNKLDYIFLVLILIIIASLRGQLAFVFLLMLLIVIMRKSYKKSIILSILSFFSLIILKNISQLIDIFITKILPSLLDLQILKIFLIKFPIYFSGFSFLDPSASKSYSLTTILFTRVLAIDSLIIPLIFTGLLFTGKIKNEIKPLVFSSILAFIIYFYIYIWASITWEGYGFHFRAYLPFFYIFYIYVIIHLPSINLGIKNK